LALSIGYPYGGTNFILLMAPYLVYMVLKCDAVFLPALMLHCASETSAFSIVFISFILLSILKYKKLIKLKLGVLFWILIGLLPIFIWLVITNILNHEMYPPLAVAQTGYYLSFYAFMYGVLVANTFTDKVLNSVYVTLFVTYLLYVSGLIEFTRIVVGFSFLFSALLALFITSHSKNPLLFVLALFSFLSVLFIKEETTLTTLFVSVSSLLLTYLYFKNKNVLVQKLTGILPFLIILVLYVYGITSYLNASKLPMPHKTNIADLQDLKNWVHWKFFFDRAPFWAGGFDQIIEYKHLFPIPEMPDITAVLRNRSKMEISFGSHTTMIELVRKYGIIAGVLLNFCLIYIVLISRKIFSIREINPYTVPLYAMAVAVTIVLTLVGQYQILPGYAILSLGILGVAYGTYQFNTENNS